MDTNEIWLLVFFIGVIVVALIVGFAPVLAQKIRARRNRATLDAMLVELDEIHQGLTAARARRQGRPVPTI